MYAIVVYNDLYTKDSISKYNSEFLSNHVFCQEPGTVSPVSTNTHMFKIQGRLFLCVIDVMLFITEKLKVKGT